MRRAQIYLLNLFIVAPLILHATTFSHAAPGAVVTLTDASPKVDLGTALECWVENGKQLDHRSVLSLPSEEAKPPGLGYVASSAWCRFRVENRSSKTGWVLKLDPPLIDEVELEAFASASAEPVARWKRGPGVVKEGETLERRKPSFTASIPRDQAWTFVARLRTPHNLDFGAQIFTEEAADNEALFEQLILGMYYGTLFALLVYNLAIYLMIRERSYLHYVLFTGSLGVMLLTLNGFTNLYLGRIALGSRYLCTLSATSLFFATLFALTFLQTRRYVPRLHRALECAMGVSAAIAVTAATPLYSFATVQFGHAIDLTIVSTVFLILASGVVTLARGFRPAAYFLLGWAFLIAMTVVFFADTYGVIAGNAFTRFGVQIGSSFEMILLSLAIAYRLRLFQSEKLEAEAKARESDQLRSLVHITCHDLRNPLSVVLAHGEINLGKGHKEWLPVVRAAREQKAILDYVKTREAYETGKLPVKLAPVSLRSVVDDSLFIFEAPIARKKLRIEQHVPDLRVLAEPTMLLHSVVGNLVSNAIKFSPTGGCIEIAAHERETFVELLIRDEGIGIPEAILRKLFSPGHATTRPGTEGEEGTGFGMPLVQSIVEAFGGMIRIESRSAADGFDRTGTSVRVLLKKA